VQRAIESIGTRLPDSDGYEFTFYFSQFHPPRGSVARAAENAHSIARLSLSLSLSLFLFVIVSRKWLHIASIKHQANFSRVRSISHIDLAHRSTPELSLARYSDDASPFRGNARIPNAPFRLAVLVIRDVIADRPVR